MENIEFIREIMKHGTNSDGMEFGNFIVYPLHSGNRAKVYVDGGGIYGESHGIMVDIISTKVGNIDSVYFPFKNYFNPVKCSENSPLWYPHIDNGEWYSSRQYSHVLPKIEDYKRIATAVCEYMNLF